jgi:predicted DNA binding CopG/RHH family protein
MADETKSLNGWNEWSRFVLKELERLNVCYKELQDIITQQTKEFNAKFDTFTEKFSDKNEKVNSRVTSLTMRVIYISATTTILTSLLFLLLTHLLKGKS